MNMSSALPNAAEERSSKQSKYTIHYITFVDQAADDMGHVPPHTIQGCIEYN